MPRVGSSKKITRGFPEQPFAEHDFLLVAARERADGLLGSGRSGVQFVDHPRGGRALAHLVDEHVAVDEVRQVRERRVFAHVMPEHEPLALTILGNEGDAGRDAVRRRPNGAARAVDDDLAASRHVGARDGAQDLGAARADQARQPDDLAGPNRNETPLTAGGRARSRTSNTTGASGATGGSSGKCASSVRPTIARMMSSGGSRAALRVSTLRPSRRTAMRSAMRGSSSMRCEM